MTDTQNLQEQHIQTFTRRNGRITKSQKNALNDLAPLYLLNADNLNLETAFNTLQPIVCEIGFGMGDYLIENTQVNPHLNFLGIEVYQSGVGAALQKANIAGLKNIKIINDDAVKILAQLKDASITKFCIMFPDPWQKKRHNKRRIIQQDIMEVLIQKLVPHGMIHLVTDWQDYAEHMWMVLESFAAKNILKNLAQNKFIKEERIIKSKYEKKAINWGHEIFDLQFIKV